MSEKLSERLERAAKYGYAANPGDHSDLLREAAAALRAVEGAAVVPVTRMKDPAPAKMPMDWTAPCFTTTFAKLVPCDESGALVPLDAADGAEGVG